MVRPILMVVSETPSVSDHPAGHFVRSTVQPSGPVSVLPSADLPQWLSLIFLTMAVRSWVQSASQPSIDVGWAAAAVVAVAALVVVLPADVPGAAVVVAPSLELSESSPP